MGEIAYPALHDTSKEDGPLDQQTAPLSNATVAEWEGCQNKSPHRATQDAGHPDHRFQSTASTSQAVLPDQYVGKKSLNPRTIRRGIMTVTENDQPQPKRTIERHRFNQIDSRQRDLIMVHKHSRSAGNRHRDQSVHAQSVLRSSGVLKAPGGTKPPGPHHMITSARPRSREFPEAIRPRLDPWAPLLWALRASRSWL